MSTGAHALIKTLADSGVEVCFSNPGTSEIHFVTALDTAAEMRAILCLFEGVATGAADGYSRIAEKPAATLLHLGVGLGNGLANLHNARRAHSSVVNIVGDHATYHRKYDAPLQSDIESLAKWPQGWERESKSSADIGQDAADAVAAARAAPGRVATLILPADISWSDGGTVGFPVTPKPPAAPDPDVVAAIADILTNGGPAALLVGGPAARAAGLAAVGRIAQATGSTAFVETFPARMEHGAGVTNVERLGFFAEAAIAQLAGIKHLIVAGTPPPVAFFAYPDKPSYLVPDGATVHTLATLDDDVVAALELLAEYVAADSAPIPSEPAVPALPNGDVTVQNWADVVAALLPPDAIISDEATTSGIMLPTATAGAPRHDVLTLTGGAIGQGLPVAIGAAVAAPDRPVIALQGDGGSIYTISALWTMARENLNITTVILNNSAYAILRIELQRVGAGVAGPKANDLFDLSRPAIDFVSIAEGFGVPATRATTCEEFAEQFQRAVDEPGPHLIELIILPTA
ncbi:acetolactate synthase large subunit [Nocardia sp. CA-128927]|uniref:acetolactate synthase large subunit n=1 Tax=Nocardia sp. CA-128927 TaxID=3239975 RepID=UPI003D968AB5